MSIHRAFDSSRNQFVECFFLIDEGESKGEDVRGGVIVNAGKERRWK